MAVPFGLSTTMYITLTAKLSTNSSGGLGPRVAISMCIAASLAEIWLTFPCRRRVLLVCAMLNAFGSRYLAPIVSFVDGWTHARGINWTVTLSIIFLFAITIYEDSANTWQTVLCFWPFNFAVLGPDQPRSAFGASVIIIIVTLCHGVRRVAREFPKVFTHYDASASGTGWSFFVGLLKVRPDAKMLQSVANSQPIGALFYVLTGSTAGRLCEEVQNPGNVRSPGHRPLRAAAGVTFTFPILFVLPDVKIFSPANQPIGMPVKVVTGSAAGGFGLLFLILGSSYVFNAGIGVPHCCVSCTYAFAVAVKMVPFRKLWSKVNHRLDMPVPLILSTVVDCILIYFGIFCMPNSFTGEPATICLSSGVVAVFGAIAIVKHSPYPLGKFTGPLINVVGSSSPCMPVLLNPE
ncbi:hypothetical protein CEK25_008862 [Fusarium fujikuroi]|nr:hypothetical protein CEK25_008862 [Fusarium fujikuroi]